MATRAKLEGNARYLAKLKSISLRMPPEMHHKISEAAKNSTNGSVQGYILKAVAIQLDADTSNSQLVKISAVEAAEYAKAAGISVEEWLAAHQAVADQ